MSAWPTDRPPRRCACIMHRMGLQHAGSREVNSSHAVCHCALQECSGTHHARLLRHMAGSIHRHGTATTTLDDLKAMLSPCVGDLGWGWAQSVGLYHSWKLAGSPGRITRLLSCTPEQLKSASDGPPTLPCAVSQSVVEPGSTSRDTLRGSPSAASSGSAPLSLQRPHTRRTCLSC